MPCRDPRCDMSPPELARIEKRDNFRDAARLLFELCQTIREQKRSSMISRKIIKWYKAQTEEVGGIAEIERTVNRICNADLEELSKELNNVTRMLCFLCKKLIKNKLEQFIGPRLSWWWKIHQKLDAKKDQGILFCQ